ncbi:MAG: proton-conducting transporter membrane subunit [Candidatus Eisenbacteria bacterium]
MFLLLPLLLVAPLGAIACLAPALAPRAGRVAIATTAAAALLALGLAAAVVNGGPVEGAHGWLRADGLSALVAVIVSVIACACAWYGESYMAVVAAHDHEDGRWPVGRYEALVLTLVAGMLLAALANNLGLLWIALEAATLASALLVGYYRRPGAVEAGWKYLLLCSVGIALALLATVLLYYSAAHVLGDGSRGLHWSVLHGVAASLDPRFVKLAFLFALVGYGAKAGLAPMHSWLPDAYSQAPTPVAALMSTALLATSLSALLRFHALTVACVGHGWSNGLLVLFGVLSMLMATPFLLVQGEYKRLLAYSSIEHTGLITLAIGIGTPLAVFGGVLHLFAQSFAKSLAFLVGGSLLRATRSRRMDHWSGALEASPALGTLLAGAGLGLVGLPPAATFLSEWLALSGAFASPFRGRALVALVALVLVFAGLAFHWGRMTLGKARPAFEDILPARSRVPLWLLLGALVLFGFWLPSPLRELLDRAVEVLVS